jgi:hypothetical protein
MTTNYSADFGIGVEVFEGHMYDEDDYSDFESHLKARVEEFDRYEVISWGNGDSEPWCYAVVLKDGIHGNTDMREERGKLDEAMQSITSLGTIYAQDGLIHLVGGLSRW